MNRRNKRTSWLQYEVYLDAMESNPALSSGRLSRHEDLVRWKSLAGDLNKCKSGPHLSAEEWRKRLNDWKSTTRCKYRKSLLSHDISMTEIETRALKVFGTTPVERDTTCWEDEQEIVEEELEVEEEEDEEDEEVEVVHDELVEEDATDAENDIYTDDSSQRHIVIDHGFRTIILDDTEDDIVAHAEEYHTVIDTNGDQHAAKRMRLQPANSSAIYEVKRTTCNNTQLADLTPNFGQQIEYQLKRLTDIQYETLQFKIARFKFNNPGFEYEPAEE